MDTLEKAELTASIRHIARFLKSGIPIYDSEVPDNAGRKGRRRRTQAITKRFPFQKVFKRPHHMERISDYKGKAY